MKEEMNAIMIESFGGPDVLKQGKSLKPFPEDNEVQIAIKYAGVNPVDWKIREGLLKSRMPYKFPLILGWDAAGVVTAKGKNVNKFDIGDEVFTYCRKPVIQQGTYAEYICFDEEHVALKPQNISLAQAASIPLVALTAWQVFFDLGKLEKGHKVLIHAGAGGVGGFAIQFAKYVGAEVWTTAKKQNHPYVKDLGADHVIDYQTQDFAQEIKKSVPAGLDFVFDTKGGETLQKSIPLVKKGGQIISIVEQVDEEICKEKGIKSGYVFVRPNGHELETIAELISQNKVKPLEINEMKLSDAKAALEMSKQGHTKGKIVLTIE